MNITVIGCGHGGQALAAHLTLAGNTVTLYADTEHPGDLKDITDQLITLTGKLNGRAAIHRLTFDIETAVKDAEVIYLSLPTEAHLPQFEKMLPYLKKGQTVLTLAGNFSSLYFYRKLKQFGKQEDIYVADLASLPYACRASAPGNVTIIDIKKRMDIAAMPSKHTDWVTRKISGHFPTELHQCASIIELGLNITSAISHPAIMLMNAGRIGSGNEEFYFYKEGISPEISNIIENLDKDRRAIASRYGYTLPGYLETMESFYTVKYDSYYDFFTRSPVHNQLKLCPASVKERYLSQDVPYVILPWLSLGQQVGYDSRTMRAIVDLASTLNNDDYSRKGRKISEDFFIDLKPNDIINFMRDGY